MLAKKNFGWRLVKMKILIEREKLISLISDSLKLQALENGGVDNWGWYDVSITDFLDEEDADSFDEIAERLCRLI